MNTYRHLASCALAFLIGVGSALFLLSPSPANAQFTTTSSTQRSALGSSVKTNPNIKCQEAVCLNTSNYCPVSLVLIRQIRNGDSGIDVVGLQDFLISQGLLAIPATTAKGTFGPLTARALAKFQSMNYLAPTGYLDEATRNNLNARVVGGGLCLNHVRHDALQITLAKKNRAALNEIAGGLNKLGLKADGNRAFCINNSTLGNCFNITGLSSFTAYLPTNISAAKAAASLISYKTYFSAVDFIRTLASSVVFRNPTATSSTAQVSTTTPYFSYTINYPLNQYTTPTDINNLILSGNYSTDPNLYREWKLVRIAGASIPSDANVRVAFSKALANEGTIKIFACNTATGKGYYSGDALKGSVFVSTQMYCTYDYLNTIEKKLVTVFIDTARYAITNNILKITTPGGATYEFTAI